MAYFDTTWYVNFGDGSTTGHYAVAKRPQNTAVVAGQLVRQFTAPAVGSERVFVCIVAGTTANVTDATWVLTRGAKTVDGTATWMECSGQPSLNGDLTNTPTWGALQIAVPTGVTKPLGQIVKRNNGASYQIVTTTHTNISASEPAFSDTAGVTTTESGGLGWTSLGPVANFTGGQAPHARLVNVFATNWFASGNTVYVGDNHAETQATNITLGPSSALMAKVLCHNRSGSYPPAASDLTTGATINTTGTAQILITGLGSFYFYGITFVAGAAGAGSGRMILVGGATVGQVQNWYYFERCSFQTLNTGGAVYFTFGDTPAATWATVILDNTTVKFADTGQTILPVNCQFIWRNTGQILAAGSSVPTSLFETGVTVGPQLATIMLEALDLSQLPGTLFVNNVASFIGSLTVKDCKLNATTTVTTPINTGMTVQLAASASDATSYKSSRYTYQAVETTETGIVRTGGYVDPAGQVQSRKIVTTANAQWLRPYAAQPLAAWNAATGSSKTVTVYGTVNAGALPNNDDIWLEVSGLTNASFPVGSTVTSGKANVWSAGSAGVSDSSTWAVPATTFDGVNTLVALSNGNLTVTHNVTTTNAGAISTAFLGAGKYYFEMGVNVSSSTYNGIGAMSSAWSGVFSGSQGVQNLTGVTPAPSSVITSNGVNTGLSLGASVAGDVFCFAIDLTARLAWIRRNNGNWNASGSADPATGVGGVVVASIVTFAPYVSFSSSSVSTDAVTANFGASSYAFTPPSGFLNWVDAWKPFKLVATFTPQMPGYLIPQVKVAKASSTFYIDPLAVVT